MPFARLRVALFVLVLLPTIAIAAPPPPGAATSPSPQNGATGVSPSVVLTWASPARAQSYDVSFGTTNPPPLVATAQTATSYQPATLANTTTYFWRVDSRGAGGTTIGTVWSFTTAGGTAPAAPSNPAPADGASGVSQTPTLAWSAASGATSYDVAFGTASPPSIVASGLTTTSWQPGALAAGTTYFWQVIARNAVGSTAGGVWRFTTASANTGPTPLGRLKLMTWNIQHGYDAAGADAVDAQVALMADANADVIGLQEVSVEPGRDLSTLYKSKLEALTGLTWNTVWAQEPYPSGQNPEGNLILTRLPIVSSSVAQWDTAPSDPTWLGAKRSAARVELVVNNSHVNVFVTHLDTDVSMRSQQLSLFMSWVAGYAAPRIAGGDFNMMPTESDYATMTASMPDAWATLVNAYQASPGPDQGYTKDVRTIAPWTGQPGRIDYWFHEKSSTAAVPSEISVLETRRSDHNALLMWVAVQ